MGDGEVVKKLLKIESKNQIYRLRYKKSNVIKDKHFEFTGTSEEAIERAREHVKQMKYQQFIFCIPFTHNLEEDEAYWIETREEKWVA